jgi:4-hydroxy-3-methylbut-2-enyl diphosphate reductase
MEIRTARIGFCIGITRAYRAMNERALEDSPFHVAHQNSGGQFDTLRRIERRDPDLLNRYPGLERVSVAHDVSTLDKGDRLVLGFHGLATAAKEALTKRGIALLDDLICPFIAKLDRVVERLASEGFDVAIVGVKDNHHCRKAQELAQQHRRRCFVIEKPEDIDAVVRTDDGPVALVGQVTGNTATFKEVVERIRQFDMPIKVVRTMCSDSHSRQRIAAELAREADVVILVDDGGGAAQSVFEVCSSFNSRVYRVSAKEEIRVEWFDGSGSVAIIGGILVPEWSIEDMARHVREMCP